MKKFTALAAAIIMCVMFLTACAGGEKAPEGMKLASIEGEPFKLYVPEEMSLNTDSGISSAFSYVPEKLIISARYSTPDDDTLSLEKYMNYCAEGYADSLELFELKSIDSSVLSGVDALKMVYTASIDGVDYTCTQLSAKYGEYIVSLNFYIPTATLEGYSGIVDSVIEEFVLCEKTEPDNDTVTDKKTPEGMKIASGDKLEYRLYVPTSWICNPESGKSEAYYPESERSNVTVTSYSPNESMGTADYIAQCEEEYAKSVKGYELLEKTELQVASRDAISMTFKANYDGIDITIKQVSFVYGE
ncbi:MAG: hypothetical protein IJV72_01885, partial [Clostridia bacterium]|nr:hypothetical protein [Clostridia bacterium]